MPAELMRVASTALDAMRRAIESKVLGPDPDSLTAESMFKRLLIAIIVFLATACVPITPEQAGPCISNERALLIGETIEAKPSDDLPGYIDIVGVESSLHDQVLTVVIHLRDIPEQLTFHRDGVKIRQIEYSWMAWVSESGHIEPWADEVEKMTRFKHRLITAHFADRVDPLLLKSASIASLAESDVWVLKRYEDSEREYPWYSEPFWKARTDVSHERDTLTMTGYVPGISNSSLLVIETYDYFDGQDRIRCDSAQGMTRQRSEPEVETATAQPPESAAELRDLAIILAKIDSADSSEKYAALLLEFSDCFLSNLTASERDEGLGDDSGEFAITPAQITAVTLFQAGVFAVVGQYERIQKTVQAEPSPHSVNMYELLEGALAVCKDSS